MRLGSPAGSEPVRRRIIGDIPQSPRGGSRRHAWIAAAGFAAALALAAVAPTKGTANQSRAADPVDAGGPLDLRSAELRQQGPRLILDVATRGPWGLDELTRFPDEARPGRAYLCLQLRQRGRSQLCLGPRRRDGTAVLGRSAPRADGPPRRLGTIVARLARPTSRSVRLSFSLGAARVRTGRLQWALASRSAPPDCDPGAEPGCQDRLPDGGRNLVLSVGPVTPTGCTSRGPSFRTHGPRNRKRIAIGFDDGPSSYTGQILRVLRRFGSRATFFQIGQAMSGRGAVMRRIIRSGSEIGNHTMSHASSPSRGALRAANRRIKRITGFRPCVFRPPGGGVSGALIARARAERLITVNWDVDPRDWATPGAGAIAANVIRNARPGSIVVMHDGGGSRAQTIAALPRILSHFRHRGYRFVTITELIGNRFTY